MRCGVGESPANGGIGEMFLTKQFGCAKFEKVRKN